MRIGVFGGTFNPIHLGHLLLAETAREELSLDRVLFVPTAQPPHKSDRDLLPGLVRLTLIRLALRAHPAFAASEIEVMRGGASYSIETVRALRRQLPDAKLFLLMGADMLAVPWVGWSELKRLTTIVVAQRPGHRPKRQASGILRHGSGRRPEPGRTGGVTWLPMPQVEIASSEIRRRIKAGRSIRYLVPDAVARYVRDHRLYQREG